MSAPTTVRRACEADAEALAELGRRTFTDNFGHLYTAQNLQHFLDGVYAPQLQRQEICTPENCVYVAEQGGELVGFLKAAPCKLPIAEIPARAYEIHRIYVLPQAKGQGIGSRFMDIALEYCRQKNAAGIYVGVWSQNYAAHRFYAHYGFVKIAEYHFMVGDDADDEWVMQLQPEKS